MLKHSCVHLFYFFLAPTRWLSTKTSFRHPASRAVHQPSNNDRPQPVPHEGDSLINFVDSTDARNAQTSTIQTAASNGTCLVATLRLSSAVSSAQSHSGRYRLVAPSRINMKPRTRCMCIQVKFVTLFWGSVWLFLAQKVDQVNAI